MEHAHSPISGNVFGFYRSYSPAPRAGGRSRRVGTARLPAQSRKNGGRCPAYAVHSCPDDRPSDKHDMDPSIYRLRQRDILSFCVLALLCLGMIMVQSAAMNVTGKTTWQWNPLRDEAARVLLRRDLAFLVFGKHDYALARRGETQSIVTHPITWLLLVTVVLNTLVLVQGIGIEKNGARRWLPLGITQLQPSELAKWAVVIFLAWWLTRPAGRRSRRFFTGFVPTLDPDRRDLPARSSSRISARPR